MGFDLYLFTNSYFNSTLVAGGAMADPPAETTTVKVLQTPPSFAGDDSKEYTTWKNELEIWKRVTDVAKRKQGLLVVMALTGRARQIGLQLKADELDRDNGLDVLVKKLDECYKRDDTDYAYEAYSTFEKFTRVEGMSISAYILEFEKLNDRAKNYNMVLPDAVLAYKLLENASFDEKERQMVLSACTELKYEKVKSSMRRIFGEHAKNDNLTIKDEPAFVTFQKLRGQYRQKNDTKPYDRLKNISSRGKNPVGRDGRITRCNLCESTYHYFKDCPEKNNQPKPSTSKERAHVVETDEEAHIVLFNHVMKATEPSISEAILDTACTANVSGEEWVKSFIKNLPYDATQYVNKQSSPATFLFGGGDRIKSLYKVTLPVEIYGSRCLLSTDVIEGKLPLLLSKGALKRMSAIIDAYEDTIQAFDWEKPHKLSCNSSGHYVIHVNWTDSGEWAKPSIHTVLKTEIDCLTEKNLTKLHKQFGHASAEKLCSLIKNAGIVRAHLAKELQEIVSKCETCIKNEKFRSRPVVAMPLANRFNEVLALDLKEWKLAVSGKLWIFHMIDEFSRFSAAVLITDKSAETIVKAITKIWILRFGPPDKIRSDNGKEFSNQIMLSLSEQYGIRLCPTSPYSPWSNGVCERHNAIIWDMVSKTICEEPKTSYSDALEHAIFAKNCLENREGYSPYQIVYGRNPRLPGVTNDMLPALDRKTVAATVSEQISLLESTRIAYLEAESSEKIKRALSAKTRCTSGPYFIGDQVYFRRDDKSGWRGPGRVVDLNGQEITVKFGGQYIAVHAFRLSKAIPDSSKPIPSTDGLGECSNGQVCEKQEKTSFFPDDLVEEPSIIDLDEELQKEAPATQSDELAPSGQKMKEQEKCDGERLLQESERCPSNPGSLLPRKGDIVDFKVKNDDLTKYSVKILGSGCKSTSKKYSNWLNVEYNSPEDFKGKSGCINWPETISQWSKCQGTDENEVLVINTEFEEAKIQELQDWKNNNVYTEVPLNGQEVITTRWVLTNKNDGSKKARLVAKGFQESDESLVKESPTCSRESMRIVIAILSSMKWTPYAIDIKTAFLQGNALDRPAYIKPPQKPTLTSFGNLISAFTGLKMLHGNGLIGCMISLYPLE